MVRWDPKSVLERGEVVDVQSHKPVDTHRFEQFGDVSRCHRVTRLAPPILACVTKVWDDGGDTFGGCIPKGPQKEQQTAELVVYTLPGVAVEALDHENVFPPDGFEGPRLVFSIFEVSFLKCARSDSQMAAHAFPELPPGFGGKHRNVIVIHRIPFHWSAKQVSTIIV